MKFTVFSRNCHFLSVHKLHLHSLLEYLNVNLIKKFPGLGYIQWSDKLINYWPDYFSVQFSSVTWSCLTLCNRMDCSTLGLPVHHQLPEFTQIHVHQVGDAIQPSHPLSSPSPPTFNLSRHQRSFQTCQFFASGGQSIGVSASASVLPMNIQDWFPLGLIVGSSCSARDSQESSPTPQFKSINSLALSFLYSLIPTSIHDYWKNHSFN